MTTRPFQQVDVFTAMPFKGNPVAVDPRRRRARRPRHAGDRAWTNLSETTFVCKPENRRADYRLRIFTPWGAALRRAIRPSARRTRAEPRDRPKTAGAPRPGVRQRAGVLRVEGDRLFLALPVPAIREPGSDHVGRVADALGIKRGDVAASASVDVDCGLIHAATANAARCLALQPRTWENWSELDANGVTGVNVFGCYPGGSAAELEVRSFAPRDGIPEDPVCGSGNGCVAALLRRDAVAPGVDATSRRRAAASGRDGRVEVPFDPDGAIWLGGHAVTCVEGMLRTAL